MPYFITDQSADCSGWATIKDNGEVLGCHESKADAIAQMVALSLAEGIDPGGERALPENYRPALALDVPEGRACGNCMFYDETNTDGDRAWCGRWDEYVRGDYYCNAWQSNERTAMSDLEIRTIDTEPLELRAAATGDGMQFSGYAARYDSPSLPLPFTERIAPGAFTRSLKSRNDIKMFVNHSDLHVLASTRSKTLRLEDRADGLFVEADLPNVSYANDLRELIAAKVVSTMSFGFSTVRDSWSDDGAERTLQEVRLHEVSVVTSTAAYPTTSASVRNLRLIARRTATDFDALTDAIAALELGELSADQANLLRTVVDSAAGKLEQIPVDPTVPMSILVNKLDLIAKQLNI
jgi:HK97 family phage prohead protease